MVRGVLLAVLATSLVPACSSPTDSLAEEIFQDALARWAENGPPSYSMVITRLCACEVLGPIRVEVQNGTIVSWTDVNENAPLDPQHQSGFPDVPGLFDLIREARREDPYFLSAAYNSFYGFPATVEINITPSRADDDLTISVTEFTPL